MNIAAFLSEGELAGWLEASRLSRGGVVLPQTLYELGAEWNATRLNFDWDPPSAAEATAIFAKHGLTGSFWSRE